MYKCRVAIYYLVFRLAASFTSISLDTPRLFGCEFEFGKSCSSPGFTIAFVRSLSCRISEYDDSSLNKNGKILLKLY